jgi:hypothetical protein
VTQCVCSSVLVGQAYSSKHLGVNRLTLRSNTEVYNSVHSARL